MLTNWYKVDIFNNSAWIGVNPKSQNFNTLDEANNYLDNCAKDPSFENGTILKISVERVVRV